MSKFNAKKTMKTTNSCGYAAYDMTDKAKLVAQVMTTFFGEPKFYGDNTPELIELATKLAHSAPEFVANLARYARKEMHLRSVSHALAALVAHEEKSKPYIKQVVADVVERPDDITEILALYISAYGKPIPNGLKKALGAALGKFDEYQISKYSGGKKAVTFKDVLRLTHVKPKTPEQQELFNKIINGTLEKAVRWETELSARGNTKEVWEELIDSGRLGYMATLRNLRNIVNAQPENLDKALEVLADKARVLKSKQLPMRFLAAYREVRNCPACSSKVVSALEKAIGYSVENMPRLPGKTVLAIDVSGSMTYPMNKRSDLVCSDIATLLAVLASKICDEYIIYSFDTELKTVTIPPESGILAAADCIQCDGGGTDITLTFSTILENKILADRLILFSDNEINCCNNVFMHMFNRLPLCQQLADKYRKEINPEFWVHAVDIMGYGTQQFMGERTNIIAGWNDRVLDFVLLAENGVENQVRAVENYK